MFKVIAVTAVLALLMVPAAGAGAFPSAGSLNPSSSGDVVQVRAGGGHVHSGGRGGGRSFAGRGGGRYRGYGGGRRHGRGYGGGYYGLYDDYGYGGYGYGPCFWVGPVRVCP